MKNEDRTAFPLVGHQMAVDDEGMNKLEYFLAAALTGIASNPDFLTSTAKTETTGEAIGLGTGRAALWLAVGAMQALDEYNGK